MNWYWQRILENDIGVSEAELMDVELSKPARMRRAEERETGSTAAAQNAPDACPCHG